MSRGHDISDAALLENLDIKRAKKKGAGKGRKKKKSHGKFKTIFACISAWVAATRGPPLCPTAYNVFYWAETEGYETMMPRGRGGTRKQHPYAYAHTTLRQSAIECERLYLRMELRREPK